MEIFGFTDYRHFIKHKISAHPEKGLTITALAKCMGVKPPFLTQVLNGSKNISHEQAFALGQTLQIDSPAQEYFYKLVSLSRASSPAYREAIELDLLKLREEHETTMGKLGNRKWLEEKNQSIFYSTWQYSAVHLASGLNGHQTPLQVSKALSLNEETVMQILNFLVAAGLCKTDGHRYRPDVTKTHLPKESSLASRYQTNWRLKGIEHLSLKNADDLFFTDAVRLDQKTFETLKVHIRKLITTLSSEIMSSGDTTLACINLECFKL